MSEPDNKPPTITLSLPRLLELLWTNNWDVSRFMSGRSIVSVAEGELIALLDKDRRYCHVEFTEMLDSNNNIVKAAQIWPRTEWESSYERSLARSKRREEDVIAKEKTWEYIHALKLAIREFLGAGMTEEQCLFLAIDYIRNKNFKKAKQFGVEIAIDERIIV